MLTFSIGILTKNEFYAIIYVVYMDDQNFTQINSQISPPSFKQPLLELLKQKLLSIELPADLQARTLEQLTYLDQSLGNNFNQSDSVAKYIDWLSRIPWKKTTKDTLDLDAAKKMMDTHHYGLGTIKTRILEYLSTLILQQKNNPDTKLHSPVLFFVGLAGTGKTTFAKSIATALSRQLVRIPFGGLAGATDLRGLSRAQLEAEPGAVMKSLASAGVKNPVILLDELDRIAPENHTEIMGVLIELLDPAQNDHFTDHYLDYPFDLSSCIFVATANNSQSIATAVLDRMELIQMPSYSDEEKIVIARDFVLPQLMNENGIPSTALKIDPSVFAYIARSSGFDPGIRSVERKIAEIVRKVAMQIVTNDSTLITITDANRREFVSD